MKNILNKQLFTRGISAIFVALLLFTIAQPVIVYAATTVTTSSATIDGDNLTLHGSVSSDQTIRGRGFELLNGETSIDVTTDENKSMVYENQIGSSILGDGVHNRPSDVAVDSSGNIYVVDQDNHRIQKFDSSGNYITKWGTQGSGDGQFSYPNGITIDSTGNIYVADTYNHRIQKFDSSGTYVSQWGTYGTGNGEFDYPGDITIDSSGNIYVTDSNNHRIQKFDSNGTYITKWGTQGNGNGQFYRPQHTAIDSSGNIYVADTYNHRIQKFDSNGNYITKWGTQGSGNGQLYFPTGIVIDSSDNIYVADSNNYRIQKFDSSGTYLTKWGTQGSGNGQFSWLDGMAVDSSGNIFVADAGNRRVQKLDASGAFMSFIGISGSSNGRFFAPNDVIADTSGDIYVADTNNHRIQKFDSSGNYITKWGTQGSGDGQFSYPNGITIDSTGNIYVADTYNHRIQKFDSNGTYITKWGTQGSGNGQFSYPNGITIDSTGNIYVADTYNHRIQKFDSNGTYITKWGTQGSGNGQLYFPTGIVIDSSDNIYVADSSNYRIQKFDSTGTYLSQWGTAGPNDGQFNSPQSITTDSNDNLYVADTNNHRIQKFDSNGTYITKWGTQGSGNGQFESPGGITTDFSGNLYVADTNNHRIQKIAQNDLPTGSYSITNSLTGLGIAELCNVTVDYRAYVETDNGIEYGSYQSLAMPVCPVADLALDITLKDPGLVQGQVAEYEFTVSNVSNQFNYEAGGVSLYIVVPDQLELNQLTDDGVYECQDVTGDFAETPSLAHHLGVGYSCIWYLPEDIATGENITLTLPFMVNGTVDEATAMRAFVLPMSPEADIEALYGAFMSEDDLFTVDLNNIAVYAGTQPGTTIAPTINTVTMAGLSQGKVVNLATPEDTNITCSSVQNESSQTTQDSDYQYPLGLVDFCFDTDDEQNQVSLLFVTDLKPSDVVARKYNSTTNTYFDIAGATITQTTYQGQQALQLTYTITDNGVLDLDPAVGRIHDPVGLAVVESGGLAITGQSVAVTVLLALMSFGGGLFALRKVRYER